MRAPLWLLAASMTLAGCSQGGDDPLPVDEVDDVAPVTAPSWTNQTFEGTFVGVNGVVATASPLTLLGDGYGTHRFTVPEGAVRLEVSIHLVVPAVEEVLLRLADPSCAAATCQGHHLVTEGGMASDEYPAPKAGEWRAAIYQESLGAGATPYHVYVGVLA